jgi:PLP dependent protein
VTEFTGSEVSIRARYAEVRERVDAALRAGGRRGESVEILVATKYVPLEHMRALAEAGVRLVGENRAQDLVAKHEAFGDTFVWDFIGHLQSRKTKLVFPIARLIHSVWTMSVVREIQARAEGPVRVLLEVNLSGEETKSGLRRDQVAAFLEKASVCDKVEFAGLMFMPPLFGDPEQARPLFASAREQAQRLSEEWRGRYTFAELSMGTSADYEVAVQEGATIVRVGSVLF